ncbi:hypothetical protein [Pseudonocardia sp. ICBG601]|uniref:hypothetical protein n=1 Tax=Pseudonocardia sp. ICBG601 TaxID=2846759 RepID=UPI001CF66121|nr:hypothetical protein [Pseudonocardia sp. ICBG601]
MSTHNPYPGGPGKRAAKQGRRPPRLRAEFDAFAVNRARLDEDADERRREDEAFTHYAQARRRGDRIEEKRDAALAALDRRRQLILTAAEEKLDGVRDEQARALAAVHKRSGGHRSTREVAVLFALPIPHVRPLLRRDRDRDTRPIDNSGGDNNGGTEDGTEVAADGEPGTPPTAGSTA